VQDAELRARGTRHIRGARRLEHGLAVERSKCVEGGEAVGLVEQGARVILRGDLARAHRGDRVGGGEIREPRHDVGRMQRFPDRCK
jgi:hypothetical protein